VYGPVGDGPGDVFFSFFFLFSFLALNYWIIFLYLHITKASPRLAPYHLKDKKGVCRLIALKTIVRSLEFESRQTRVIKKIEVGSYSTFVPTGVARAGEC
jgi:hypothetical protein